MTALPRIHIWIEIDAIDTTIFVERFSPFFWIVEKIHYRFSCVSLSFSKKVDDYRPIDHAIFRRRSTRLTTYRYSATFPPVYLIILIARLDALRIDPAISIHLLGLGQVCLPFYTAVHLSFVKQRRSRLGDLFQLQAAFTARRILADRTKIYFSTSRDARSSKCPVNYLAVIDHLRSRR